MTDSHEREPRTSPASWDVVGIYCDGKGDEGDGKRHRPEPIVNYRRLLDDGGKRYWAQLFTSNDRPEPLSNNDLAWLNGNEVVAPARGDDRGDRAHETFNCPECGFNFPRRWEDVERVLDNAFDANRPRLILREWEKQIRRR
jgi:hypothetical protein